MNDKEMQARIKITDGLIALRWAAKAHAEDDDGDTLDALLVAVEQHKTNVAALEAVLCK